MTVLLIDMINTAFVLILHFRFQIIIESQDNMDLWFKRKWYSCWMFSRGQKTSVPVIDSLLPSPSQLKFALKFARICKHWVKVFVKLLLLLLLVKQMVLMDCEGIQCQWTDSRPQWIQLLAFTVCFKAVLALNSHIK